MKKIYYILSFFVFSTLLFWGCSDDDENTETTNTIQITSSDEAVKISESENNAEITLDSYGSTATITVQSNIEWKIEEDSDGNWCKVNREENKVTFSADEFVSDYIRTTVVKITAAGTSSYMIKISQAGTEAATLTLDPTSVWFQEVGGSEKISVLTNQDEWVVTGYEDSGWLTVEKFDDYFTVTAGQSAHPEETTVVLTVTAGTGENRISKTVEVTQERLTPAYIELGQTGVTLPPKGGKVQIEVTSNRSWRAETTDSWLDMEYDENYIYLSASSSSIANQGTITVIAGEGNDTSTEAISVRQVITPPFIVEVVIENAGDAMLFFGNDEVDCYVDWGDETGNSYQLYIYQYGERDDLRHVYQNAGTYKMAIYGTVPHLYWPFGDYEQERYSLKKVLQWGDLKITNMQNAFLGTGITEVAEGGENVLTNVTLFNYCFQNCRDLKSIPANIFKNSTLATDFTGTFFGCNSLEAIPAGLFDNCTTINSAASLFRECIKITSVPENLLNTFTEVDNIGGMFADCSSLKSVPVSLFDNCKNVNSAWCVFQNCTQLEGESPYTVIDGGIKVHLYEREKYPNLFEAVTNYWGCFENCTLLEDFDQIPEDWKK